MKNLNFTICFSLIFASVVYGQPGKDGSLTVTAQNQVVNRYGIVTGDIAVGSLSLSMISGPSLALCQGDLIMVYQAQGASMNVSNNNSYGNIINYNSAGWYEFKYVQSVSGNVLNVQTAFTNSYSASGKTQIIKVPQYSTLTINPGASIIAKAWMDTTISSVLYRFGGLVVLHANTVINDGTISTSGTGFRGGQIFNTTFYLNGINTLISTSPGYGGEKGEGVFGFHAEYDANGGRYCRGAAANGGGGGNSTNAGGGGGANGFNGNTWSGQGVMITDANNPFAAWSLDPGFIANSNALTSSSGGGRGGYSWGDLNGNGLTQGPGNTAWSGDFRSEVGGIGGRPLTNINAESRIFFGGGGGLSHRNNNASPSGSSGGGIVYIVSGSITGSGNIQSNGLNVGNSMGCHCDGLSGAGAGGSIVLKTGSIATTQTVSAIGGNGGNQMVPVPPAVFFESEGPGGGGGGGFVAIASAGVIPTLNGGSNGTSLSNGVTEMTSNGATAGATGQSGTVTANFISYVYPAVSVTSLACIGSTASILSQSIGSSYIWNGPGGYTSTSNPAIIPNFNLANAGIYSLTVLNNPGCGYTVTFSVSAINSPTLSILNKTICVGAKTTLSVSGALTYSWNTAQTTPTIQVTPITTTVYIVSGVGSNGCKSTSTVQAKHCIGLKEERGDTGIMVYPNPSKGDFTVQSLILSELRLMNELGELVMVLRFNESNKRQYTISGLAKGIYFLTSTEEKPGFSFKLVVSE